MSIQDFFTLKKSAKIKLKNSIHEKKFEKQQKNVAIAKHK